MIKTLSKDAKNFTDRSEPARFFGDGVQFKAKLIGILEVGEARGDRMCQEALQDLKMAIRAAGEHKQRITIHVTIDGLRLRDEKTGDSLYHHPVHKISFIAQDMHDSRAFGYIFGSPDSGHRFFGIKTDKAASQVVLAMRDLFQVVFELKKKEIELARQQIQSKIAAHEHQAIAQAVKNSTLDSYTKNAGESASTSKASPPNKNEKSPESVADLVDLEQELSSIQRGITQMERITPGEAPVKSSLDDDPFGDSFTKFSSPFNILPPPPENSRRNPKSSSKPVQPAVEEPTPAIEPKAAPNHSTTDDWLNSPPHTSIVFPDIPKSIVDEFSSKLPEENIMRGVSSTSPSLANMIASMSSTAATKYHDAFSELDPLKKPYVDKKFFFQDVKNPPKKVLRDLTATGQDSLFDVNFSGGQPPTTADLLSEFVDLNASGVSSANTSNSAILSNDLFSNKATNNSSRKDESLTSISSNDFVDPFSNRDIDPFDEEEFCKLPVADPFENLHFPPSKSAISPKTVTVLPDTKITTTNDDADEGSETLEAEKSSSDSVYNGPLQVNLPPESWANYISQKRLERQNSDGQQSGIARNRPSVFKQNTVDVISMKKMKPTNIFGQKFTKRDSNSINMRRLQESDSLSENEAAPEPPPRPDTSSQIAPPPLPPKKQFSDIVIRPSAARPSSGSSVSSRDSNRYDYVAAKLKSQQQQDAPPLPLPSRKVPGGRYESTFPGPGRPQKKPVDEDDYLTPISTLRTGDIPTLLPPPQKKDASKTRAPRKSSETDTRQLNDAERQRLSSTQSNEEPVLTAPPPLPPISTHPLQPVLPDITLSQLLTLGIDELATKLNVSTSKLNTMTIVELTSYLSNFIEASKPAPAPPPPVERPMLAQMKNESPTPVFRVSFDEGGPNEVTFVAKFDDNFADDPPFVANFDSFNQAKTSASPQAPAVDRYAAFREILGQDSSNEETPPLGNDGGEEDMFATQTAAMSLGLDKVVADQKTRMSPNVLDESVVKMKRIDTKITETIANAKDRYAALRDIIMVEDLFEKPPLASEESFTEQDDDNECDDDDYDDATATFNTAKDNEDKEVSPEINITETQEAEASGADDSGEQPFNSNNLSSIFSATVNKDDIEIDEYMNRAISNLSLDSRVSPIIVSKSPSAVSPVCRQTPQPISKSPQPVEQQLLSAPGVGQRKPSLHDMSTSPIPIVKSPSLNKSPVMQKSPISSSKSPIPPTTPSQGSVNLEPSYKNISNSANRSPADDMICGSSPEYESGGKGKSQQANTESWATFDQVPTLAPPATGHGKKKQHMKSSRDRINKEMLDSPCSSDGKEEWKERGFSKKWPARGQNSSSSRDVSPWDEDDPEYRRRPRHGGPPPPPTSGSRYDHPRSLRRLNSGDDDYGYEEEIYDRRGRRIISRSRENFDSDSKSWYHSTTDHQNWSPAEEERCSFDRAAYERSTYGPPYEKREPKSLPMYDRRGGGGGSSAGYDRRKYYRGGRSGHDYEYDDPYSESMGRGHRRSSGSGKLRKDYDDEYEAHYEMANRGSRGDVSRSRDYFYERDKRSFDRESNESYESAGGRRRKSFGSGDIYGERDRYAGAPHPEHTRSLRRGANGRNNVRKKHADDTQDSESDVMTGSGRRSGGSGEMGGSHRSSRQQKIAMEEDEVWGPSAGSGEFEPRPSGNPATSQKPWNRPSSASESDRHLTDRNRVMMNPLSGSDGEDRRFRKKPRSGRGGGKEMDTRGLHYATMRKYRANAPDEYYDCEEPAEYGSDEDQNGQMRPRHADYEEDAGSYYGRRGPYFRGSTSRLEGNSQDRGPRYAAVDDIAERKFRKSNSRDFYTDDREPQRKYGEMASPKSGTGSSKHVRIEFDFENFPPTATTPQSSANSNNKKFNFEESGEGFESDFLNSPPAAPANSGGSTSDRQKTFRFSNDFSDKDSPARQQQNAAMFSFDADFANNSTKLRFNETVKVSKPEKSPVAASRSPQPAAQPPAPAAVASFEDDFSSKTSFDELEDQWNPEIPKKNNNSSFKMRQKQQDNIKKSESINIFAKKADPFDDPFFEETKNGNGSDNNNSGRAGNASGDFGGWNRNFANFDDNSQM